MSSPPEIIDTPITANRLCTYSTSKARQLYKRRCIPKEWKFFKAVEATEAE